MEAKYRYVYKIVTRSMSDSSSNTSLKIECMMREFPILRRVAIEACNGAFERSWNETDAIETLRVVLKGATLSQCRLLKHVPKDLMYAIFNRKKTDRKLLSLKLILAGSRLREGSEEEEWFKHVPKNISVALNDKSIHFDEEEKRIIETCLEEKVTKRTRLLMETLRRASERIESSRTMQPYILKCVNLATDTEVKMFCEHVSNRTNASLSDCVEEMSLNLNENVSIAASQCRNLSIVHSVTRAFVENTSSDSASMISALVRFLIEVSSSSAIVKTEARYFLQLVMMSVSRVVENVNHLVVWIRQNQSMTPYALPVEKHSLLEHTIDSIVLSSKSVFPLNLLIETADMTYLENLFCDLIRADTQGSSKKLPRPLVSRIVSWQERFEVAKNIVLKRFTVKHTHNAVRKAWIAHARNSENGDMVWWWRALSNLLKKVSSRIRIDDLMSTLRHRRDITCLENTDMLLDLALELSGQGNMFDLEKWIRGSLNSEDLEFAICLCTVRIVFELQNHVLPSRKSTAVTPKNDCHLTRRTQFNTRTQVLLRQIEMLPLSVVSIVMNASLCNNNKENISVDRKTNDIITPVIICSEEKQREKLRVSLDLLNCAASRRIRGESVNRKDRDIPYLRLYKRLRDMYVSSPSWWEHVRTFVIELKEVWNTFAIRLRGMKRSFVDRHCKECGGQGTTWRLHVLLMNDLVASEISKKNLLMALRPVPREIEMYLNSDAHGGLKKTLKRQLDQFLCGESPPNLLALWNLFVRTLFRASSKNQTQRCNDLIHLMTRCYKDWIPISFLFRGIRQYLIHNTHEQHCDLALRLSVELQRNRDATCAMYDWNNLFDVEMCTQVLKWERSKLMNAIGTYFFDNESNKEAWVETATILRDRLNWLISRPSCVDVTKWRLRFSEMWNPDEANRSFSFERWIRWELEVPDAIPNEAWHEYYKKWMYLKLHSNEFKGNRKDLVIAITRGMNVHFNKSGTRFCPNIVLIHVLVALKQGLPEKSCQLKCHPAVECILSSFIDREEDGKRLFSFDDDEDSTSASHSKRRRVDV